MKRGRPPINHLTTRQHELLGVFKRLTKDNMGPPTVRQTAEAMGMATPTAFVLMNVLVTKGALVKRPSGRGFALAPAR